MDTRGYISVPYTSFPMKKVFLPILTTLLLAIPANGQTPLSNLEPSFFAIIVKDIDRSISWYSSALGFEILNKNVVQDRGLSQANLKRGSAMIELIALDSAISPNELAPEGSKPLRIIGLFKIGFSTPNFDEWVEQLKSFDAKIQESVVKDPNTGQRMVIIKDPDGNRIQLFEK